MDVNRQCLPVTATSRYGYFPLWILPVTATSRYGYFLLWLLPVVATSRYGYFPSTLSHGNMDVKSVFPLDGYFPLRLLPFVTTSHCGYFPLWLLPVVATSRYGLVVKQSKHLIYLTISMLSSDTHSTNINPD